MTARFLRATRTGGSLRGRLSVVLIVAGLLSSSVAAGAETPTTVYGDPGSGDFSTALAVASGPDGSLYAMGAFFGEFQGVTAVNGFDVWMAKIGTDGAMEWLQTWDYSRGDGRDWSEIANDRTWDDRIAELQVDPDGNVTGQVDGAVFSVTADGEKLIERDLWVTFDFDLLEPLGWKRILGRTPTAGIYSLDYFSGTGYVVWFDLEDEVRDWIVSAGDDLVLDFYGYDMLAVDGGVVVAVQVERFSFESPAVRVIYVDDQGTEQWRTELNGSCLVQRRHALMDLGDRVGFLSRIPDDGTAGSCDHPTPGEYREEIIELDSDTGTVMDAMVVRDEHHLHVCDDPRVATATRFDESSSPSESDCQDGSAVVVDNSPPLVTEGTPSEVFAIVGMQDDVGEYVGYGVLRTIKNGARWVPFELDYIGPRSGMLPYDMVVTQSGTAVVGRVLNTAWLGSVEHQDVAHRSYEGIRSSAYPNDDLGAAAVLASGFELSGRFLDDNESVFEQDIEWLDSRGITRGCNPPANTLYCPDKPVTRGQMAAFLVRALALPAAPSAGFVDTVGSTFEADIDRLAAAGITRGCNPPANDRFCPDDPVRREVMAAFLVRALSYTDDGGGDLFTDDDGSIFESDIDKLATADVTRGCNPPVNDRFCPASNVTRGQMAAFLHRALG